MRIINYSEYANMLHLLAFFPEMHDYMMYLIITFCSSMNLQESHLGVFVIITD